MNEISCPQCHKKYKMKPELLGRQVRCSKCSNKFRVGDDPILSQPIDEPLPVARLLSNAPVPNVPVPDTPSRRRMGPGKLWLIVVGLLLLQIPIQGLIPDGTFFGLINLVWLIAITVTLFPAVFATIRHPWSVKAKFQHLGDVTGMSLSEIVSAVGPFQARSAINESEYLVQWMDGGFHISLVFKVDTDKCLGIDHESDVGGGSLMGTAASIATSAVAVDAAHDYFTE